MSAQATLATGSFDPLLFMKLVRDVGHGAALGLRYSAHGDDWVELVLPADPRLVGDPDTGMIASGPVIGLMDMAMSMAIWIARDRFVPQATLDLRLDSLGRAAPGVEIVGRGECVRLNGNLAFARGTAHQGKAHDPVAHVAATYMATAGMATAG